MIPRKETIALLSFTAGIVILALLQRDETFFIYGLSEMLLWLLFACTLGYAIFRLLRDKRPISLFRGSQSVLFGLALVMMLKLFTYFVDTDGGKKRLFTCGFDHDLAFIYAQFFHDGTFKLLNSGPFGGEILRGKYTLKNDTLTIDNSKLKHLYPSLCFTQKETDKNKKYFYPIDSSKSMFALKVYKDYRNEQ